MKRPKKNKIKSKKVLVIHGPNLSLLGQRELDIYGSSSLDEINRQLKLFAKKKGIELKIVQTNHEGEIVDLINKGKDKFLALLINPAAYTHTSVAIRDAILAAKLPTVEVHLSNIYAREDFRRKSLISDVVTGGVYGFGSQSYLLGLEAISFLIKSESPPKKSP